MTNFYMITKENNEKHDPNWPQICYYSYRITGGSGSGKAIFLLNLLKLQPDINKIKPICKRFL